MRSAWSVVSRPRLRKAEPAYHSREAAIAPEPLQAWVRPEVDKVRVAVGRGLVEQNQGPARVAHYSRLAGERMIAVQAFEEALPHLERAWRARGREPLDEESAAILAALGRAQAATALRWNRQAAWNTLRWVLEYYVERGDLDRAAALATHPSVAPEGVTGVVSVLSRILAGVPERSPVAGARLARAAAAEYFEIGDYARASGKFESARRIATSHRDGFSSFGHSRI